MNNKNGGFTVGELIVSVGVALIFMGLVYSWWIVISALQKYLAG
jgi:hypothetical protein